MTSDQTHPTTPISDGDLQIAREAAADAIRNQGSYGVAEDVLAGRFDDHPAVQSALFVLGLSGTAWAEIFDPASPPESHALRFGDGKLVVDVGSFYGRPSVFVRPIEVAGAIGERAAEQGSPDQVEPGEAVWTFPTEAQARSVARALYNEAVDPPPDTAVAGELAGHGAWDKETRIAINTDAESRLAHLEGALPFQISKHLSTISSHVLAIYDATSNPVVRDAAVAMKANAVEAGEAFLAMLAAPPVPNRLRADADAELEELSALSERAHPGPWLAQELEIVGAERLGEPWKGGDIIADMPSEGDDSRSHWPANRAFIVALVNAYRSGRLAPASSGQGDADGWRAAGFVYVDPEGRPYWRFAADTEFASQQQFFGKADAEYREGLIARGWRCVPIALPAAPVEPGR